MGMFAHAFSNFDPQMRDFNTKWAYKLYIIIVMYEIYSFFLMFIDIFGRFLFYLLSNQDGGRKHYRGKSKLLNNMINKTIR